VPAAAGHGGRGAGADSTRAERTGRRRLTDCVEVLDESHGGAALALGSGRHLERTHQVNWVHEGRRRQRARRDRRQFLEGHCFPMQFSSFPSKGGSRSLSIKTRRILCTVETCRKIDPTQRKDFSHKRNSRLSVRRTQASSLTTDRKATAVMRITAVAFAGFVASALAASFAPSLSSSVSPSLRATSCPANLTYYPRSRWVISLLACSRFFRASSEHALNASKLTPGFNFQK